MFNFREFLAGNRVEICCGQRGGALRSFFHGDGYLGNGALFSVRNSIVVLSANLEGELVKQTITAYTATRRRDKLFISDNIILKDAFTLPEALEHFRLPFKLAQGYLFGTEQYTPLYWTETDQFLTGCYGNDTVNVYCVGCSEEHALPIEVLLKDQEARLLLCRNHGYLSDLAHNLRSEVRDGFLPLHLCPTQH